MTSGTPDYMQTVRQNYGGAEHAAGFATAVANNTVSLFTVTGKGVIYGGVVYIDYATTQAIGLIFLYVDGVAIGWDYFSELLKYNITVPSSYPFYILKYDNINFEYCVALSKGITFESSFEMKYTEGNGGTPFVEYDVQYALL